MKRKLGSPVLLGDLCVELRVSMGPQNLIWKQMRLAETIFSSLKEGVRDNLFIVQADSTSAA
jgi:hypothetical protein